MRRGPTLVLAAAPGLVLAAVALAGWSPGLRDAPTYFAPLRARTAAVLLGRHSPFWNPDSGCGEPYFANPQTAVLYPPAWTALVLPPETAVGFEAGLHLALLGAGCALLAIALGCSPGLAVAAAWGATVAGPSVDAVGVLNNLESLAWLPWIWWAAVTGKDRWLPGLIALAWLGAEPQLTVLGLVITVTLVPRLRVLLASGLGLGLVAVQVVPFAAWVSNGDRGPALVDAVRGALAPAQLLGLLFPGAGAAPAADAFVVHTTVPLWVAVLGTLAVWRCRGPARRLAVWSWLLVAAAVVAGLPWGERLWTVATLGLVRYPARLVMISAVALAPAAAAVAKGLTARWRSAAIIGGGAAAAGLLTGAAAGATIGQAAALTAILATPWSSIVALTGCLLLAPLHVPALELGRERVPSAPCLDAQRGRARIYSLAPSQEQLAWLVEDPRSRAAALGYGYTALLDGRQTARSFAPLSPRSAAEHLAAADRGPEGRWWLDSLAAGTMVGQRRIPGFEVVCEGSGVVVMANPQAWPEVSVARTLPAVGRGLSSAGVVRDSVSSDASAEWTVEVGGGGGVLVRLSTPDPGWRWSVDGRRVHVLRGPGIIHGVALEDGRHRVQTRYIPPGLVAGLVTSAVALICMGVLWRRW